MQLKDISIKDFTQINKYINQWQKDKDDHKFEQSLINLFKLNDKPILETNKIIQELMLSFNAPVTEDYSKFTYDFKNYSLINFDKIKVGRFIDADNYYNEPDTLTNFMVAIFDDGEPYEGTVDKKDIFDDMPCIYFLYAKKEYIKYKETLVQRFKYLYTKEEPEEEKEGNQQRLGAFKIGGGEEDFQEEFGWYSMLFTFSKEQYMSIRDVESNVYADEFLTFINFFKRKCQLDTIRIKNG